jgi:hypothetical protein
MLRAVLAAAAVSFMACSAAWALPALRSDLAFNSSDVVLVGKKHHGKKYGRGHYGKYGKRYGGNRYGYYGRSHRYGYYGRRHHYGYPYSYGYYDGYRRRPGVSLFFSF